MVTIVIIMRTNAKCPPKELLENCFCAKDEEIICGGSGKIEFSAIFDSLSDNLTPNDKRFKKLYINNTAIVELNETLFSDILFDEIAIQDAKHLSFIHNLAFSANL